MSKIDLVPITGANNLSAVNSNFQKIGEALNAGVLFRDNPENEPNQLITDVDVNGARLYNLRKPELPSEPIRLADIGDVTAITDAAAAYAQQSEQFAESAELSAQNAATSANNSELSAQASQAAAAFAGAQADYIEDVLTPNVQNLVTQAQNHANSSENSALEAEDWALEAKQEAEKVRILFEIHPHNGPIEYIPVGSIGAFGQTWFADTYPEAAAALEDGKQFMVSEVLWQTGITGNPDAYKGCWSSGGTDGSGRRWYRAPKLNRDDDYRAPFLRGSEIGVDAGLISSAQQSILGSASVLNFNAASSVGVNHVGPENSPLYHGVIMCIRMFGTVSNPGSVDAAQLATDLGVANAKIAQLEAKGQLSATGSAVLIGVDNTIEFSNIVNECGLEKGDVIRLVFSGYDKLHTVESLINSNKVCVNYEHCGGRGNGPLKLQDFTGSVTITRIAKWFNAPLGLGQAHVKLSTNFRAVGLDYPNSTGRAILIACPQTFNANQQAQIKVDSVTYTHATARGDAAWSGYAGTLIPANSTYGVPAGGGRATVDWTEIR